MKNNIADDIRTFFKDASVVSKDDLNNYFRDQNINLTDSALRKRIYLLKNAGIITSVKSGYYTVEQDPVFSPHPDDTILKIVRLFSSRYNYNIDYCIWSSGWVHDFMIHQPFKYLYLFETEKDVLEEVFFLFKDNNLNAFLQPDKSTLTKYALESKNPVVILPLVSRSPDIEIKKIKYPVLEKILVDMFFDSNTFFYYQGQELINIFTEAFKTYHIDYSKLLNYAERRKQKTKLIEFLETNISAVNINLLR